VWKWDDEAGYVLASLQRVRVGTQPVASSYMDDGHFCSLSCGYFFGRWHADHGNVLIVKNKVGKDG
jgi:hypothetical protein